MNLARGINQLDYSLYIAPAGNKFQGKKIYVDRELRAFVTSPVKTVFPYG